MYRQNKLFAVCPLYIALKVHVTACCGCGCDCDCGVRSSILFVQREEFSCARWKNNSWNHLTTMLLYILPAKTNQNVP
jgi:hypothetical protein